MMELARHRGPDGFGLASVSEETESISVFHSRNLQELSLINQTSRIVLGHCRLAVVDVSNQNAQPRRSQTGSSLISYNGEIYNYRELRQELTYLGHTFETDGDTEVLMAVLEEWGVAGLRRLRGMFAFIFVDTQRDQVLIARDEFGIKPLYRWVCPDGIQYFASEIKQFTSLNGWTPLVNIDALRQFIDNGITDEGGRTLFRDVFELCPGTALVGATRDLVFREIHWASDDIDKLLVDFEEMLAEVVKMHLRSDVEVGACLSGGMDSSALVAVASEVFRQSSTSPNLKTFTATSADPALDESMHAELISRRLGVESTMVVVQDGDLASIIDELTWHQDLPFSSASVVAQWLVFREIKQAGLKVVLDGQGADELLGGYDDHIAAAVIESMARGRIVRAMSLYRSFSDLGRVDLRRLIEFVALIYGPRWMLAYRRNWRNRRVSHTAPMIFSSPVLDQSKIVEPIPRFSWPTRIFDSLRRHQTEVGLRMLLRFEDRSSMAMSVESRVPFLDRDFVRHCRALDAESLIQPSNTKVPLRDALIRRVGKETWNRRDKIGFAVPQSSWIAENASIIRPEVIAFLAQFSYMNEATITDAVDTLIFDPSQHQLVWRLFSAGVWMRQFEVGVPLPERDSCKAAAWIGALGAF